MTSDTAIPHHLPALTPKQMAFVQGLARGLPTIDAWTAAYAATGSRRTHYVNAYRLKGNPKIQAWLGHLQARHLGQAACSYDRHMLDLYLLRETAKAKGRMAAAVTAEIHRGKAAGIYGRRGPKGHGLRSPLSGFGRSS